MPSAVPSKRNPAYPFDIKRSVVHLLHRAEQCTADTFSTRLAHRDLTPRQFAVLVAVAVRESATQTTITEDTGIDRSTMVDVVRRLMKRGLLQRRRSRLDARSYIVRLTDLGRKVADAALPEATEVDQAILSALSVDERNDFVETLSRIVETLTAASMRARASGGRLDATPSDADDAVPDDDAGSGDSLGAG